MRWPPVLPSLLALTLCTCTTITEDLPNRKDPTPTGPGAIPVVVVPVPVPAAPTPTPAATPTPAPAATPTPAPPPPAAQSCPLPPGPGAGTDCPYEQPSFLKQVEAALDAVVQENPQWFDLNNTRGGCDNCYFVKKPDQYVNRVAELITKNGICGHYDGEELAVKNSNAFNDQYDIFTSDGYIRRQYGSYRSTCKPAWF
jgi:hypothetical protein